MNKVNIIISGDLITRETKLDNEEKYNDPNKYIILSKSNTDIGEDLKKVLCEIPEFNAGEEATITNTGLIVFKDLVKDLVSEEDETITDTGFTISKPWAYSIVETTSMAWDDITPDFTSTSKLYTEFNNPLGVRKIYVNKSKKKLTGEVYYKYNNNGLPYYVFNMDCDLFFSSENENGEDVNKIIFPEDDGVFKSKNYMTNIIGYEYKQSRIITFYNCSGSVNGISQNYALKGENDSVYLDFTNETDDIPDINELSFIFFDDNLGDNAYVEVR